MLLRKRFLFYLLIMTSLIPQFAVGVSSSFLTLVLFFVGLSELFFMTSDDKENQQVIFRFAFVFYLTYMIVCNIFWVKNPYFDCFPLAYNDQLRFYSYIYKFQDYAGSIDGIFEAKNISYFDKNGLLFFSVMGWITLVAEQLGECNIYVMKLLGVFSAALTQVYTYRLLALYINKDKALKATCTFALLSCYLFLSQPLLRDSFLSLFFVAFTYYFLRKPKGRTIPHVLKMAFIVFCVQNIRYQHGLFLWGALLVYCLFLFIESAGLKLNAANLMVYSPFLLLLLVVLFYLDLGTEVFVEYEETVDGYTRITSKAIKSSSLVGIATSLPWGLRHIFSTFFGFIIPFPFWFRQDAAPGGFLYFLFLLPQRISIVFWLCCVSISFKGLFSKKLRDAFCIRFWSLYVMLWLLIMISSVNFMTRRVMCCYPLLYVFAVYSYYKLPAESRKLFLWLPIVVYMFMHIIYFVVK